MDTAALLNIYLTANTTQANAALAKTQGQLAATGKTATATSATMKKAMLGIGVAAAGAGAALFAIGKEFDDAYDKIRIRTGATGKEMQKLKNSFRGVVSDVPATFEDASQAVGDLNTRLGLSGKPLRDMSKRMLELSRITDTDVETNVRAVSRAFVDWEVKTKDQAKTLDGFFRLSQESGLAVADIAESVQKFGSPLRQLGFTLEESAAMFASFERAGVNAQTMVPGFKLAISNLTRPTETLAESMKQLGIKAGDPEKALKKVFGILSDENRSQIVKTGLAMDVFGKRAGADMAEAIKQGRFELDEFVNLMKNGQGTILETGRKTMDAAEQFQVFKNNVMLALEPLAKDVFKGLGNLMEDITQAFKKGGINEVIDLLSQKLADAAPKIAEAGLKIGGAIIKGIWNAFWDTNLLGKLFMAGVFIRLIGGAGVLTSLGAALGTKIFTALAATRIGAYFVQSLWPALQSALLAAAAAIPMTGIAAAIAIPLGAALGVAFHDEVKDVLWKGALDKIKMPESVKTLFREQGKEAFREWVTNARKAGMDVTVATVKAWEESGAISKDMADKMIHQIKRVDEEARQSRERMARSKGWGFGEAMVQDHKITKQESQGLISDIRDMPEKQRKIAAEATLAVIKQAKKAHEISGDEYRDLKEKVLKELGETTKKGIRQEVKFARGTATLIGQVLPNAVNRGLEMIGINVQGILSALGVGEKFTFKPKQVGKALGAISGVTGIGAQRGGHIATGAASGDSVPAMLERNEYVLNREAVKRIGVDVLDRINFGVAPRMQSGGLAGLQPGIAKLAQWAGNTLGLSVSSGLRAGTGSFHNTGEAVDLVPPSMRATQSIFANWRSQLEELFYDPWGGWDSGQMIGAIGGHMDHIHAAILGAGGPGGGLAAKIARVILKGPKGPLRDAGQAALDKTRRAANQFLAKQAMPTGMAGIGGMSKGALMQLWSVTGKNGDPALMAAIALAESGGDPTAVNASSQATGLWQILPSTWSDYGKGPFSSATNPQANATAAHAILAGQGLGAWEAYTNGAYRSYMKKGGLVGRIHDLQKILDNPKLAPGYLKKLKAELKTLKGIQAAHRGTARKVTNLKGRAEMEPWASTVLANESIRAKLDEQLSTLTETRGFFPLRDAPTDEEMLASVDPATGRSRALDDYLAAIQVEIANREQEAALAAQLIRHILIAREVVLTALDQAQVRRTAMVVGRKTAERQLEGVNERIQHLQKQKGLGTKQKLALEILKGKRKDLRDKIGAYKSGAEKIRGFTTDTTGLLEQYQGLSGSRAHLDVASLLGYGTWDFLPGMVGGKIGPSFAGDILTAQSTLNGLRQEIQSLGELKDISLPTADTSTTDALRLEMLQAELARLRAHELQHPAVEQFFREAGLHFQTGGVVPGIGPVPAMVHGGEGVFTPEQMAAMGGPGQVTVIIEDGAVDANRIRVEVDGVLQRHVRTATTRGPAVGRRTSL